MSECYNVTSKYGIALQTTIGGMLLPIAHFLDVMTSLPSILNTSQQSKFSILRLDLLVLGLDSGLSI